MKLKRFAKLLLVTSIFILGSFFTSFSQTIDLKPSKVKSFLTKNWCLKEILNNGAKMEVPVDSLNNELALKFGIDKSFNLKSLSNSEEVNGTWIYERNKKQIALKDNNGDVNAIVTTLDNRILILQLISNYEPKIELFKDLKLSYVPCE